MLIRFRDNLLDRLSTYIFLLPAVTVFIFCGCVSSEETGAGDRARSPVSVPGTIDTAHTSIDRNINMGTGNELNNTVDYTDPSLRVAPKLRTKQDTVRASIIRKKKSSVRPRITIERPEHPVYTVQIGAFAQASKALSTQKTAKDRFVHQPVFNKYIKNAKVYRVSIGRYENREDAFALADTMKLQYPDEYNKCWINFIP